MMAARQTNALMLPRLLQGLTDVSPVPSIEVTHIALDSREVQPGGVFLACQGLTSHGLDFLHQALRLGAKVILWEPVDGQPQSIFPATVTEIAVPNLAKKVGQIAARFYGEPANSLRVTGITGTNGKTSCAHLLAQALTRNNAVCGVLGTLGQGIYRLNSPLQPGTHTTPNAVTVQSMLADFVTQDASHAAMEVSSHALDQGRVSGLQFYIAIFTNLTHDHLDYHGDLLHYASAKQKLFLSDGLRYAVVNADDDTGRAMLKTLPETVSAIAYGLDDNLNSESDSAFKLPANSRGLFADCRLHGDGLTLRIKSSFGDGELSAQLLGRFNAYNLLAVLGALLTLDVPFQKAINLLSQSRTVPGRMECFGGNTQPLAVVDYAHTPDALRQVLIAARAHCTGKLYCVFGCGGDRDTAKRPMMGALAATLADELILTDDNPRTEDPMQIINGILTGIENKNNVHIEPQRAKAIEQAVNRAQVGDVILIAGKGHEDYQIYGNEQRSYSDRTTVQQLLGGAV